MFYSNQLEPLALGNTYMRHFDRGDPSGTHSSGNWILGRQCNPALKKQHKRKTIKDCSLSHV